MLIDLTKEDQELLVAALEALSDLIIELSERNGCDPEKMAQGLKEVDILKQKIIG